MISRVQRENRPDGRPGNSRPSVAGFTLVEILIVVVILGILAAMVIPKLSNASQMAAENTMKEDLRYMRMQIQVYKFQHNEKMPGWTGAGYDAEVFRQQLTMPTNVVGEVGSAGDPAYPHGPYLRRLPTNPLNGKTTIRVVEGVGPLPDADGSHGWIYLPDANKFMADLPGTDHAGVAYVSY